MKKSDMNVPRLRFPGFQGEWRVATFKDVGIKIIDGDRGANYPNGDDFSSTGYCLFLNAKNVTKSGFAFTETSFISSAKDKLLRNGKLQRNDLVLTTRGSVGHIAYFDENVPYDNVRINSGMVLIRIPESINPIFCYVYFNTLSLKRQIDKVVFGSAQPQLTVGEITKFPISLPEINEQTKVSQFFLKAETKLTHLKKKKSLLEQYKKGMMQKIFNQEVRFKDDDGKEFGEWEIKKLGSVSIVNPKSDRLPPTFVYIDLESVESGKLIKESTIDLSEAPSRAQRLLRKNDILFQMVRPYQKNNLFFKMNGDYVASTGYAQIRTSQNAQFIYQYLHLQRFVDEVIEKCTGTSYPSINASDLASIDIPIPSKEEQTKIANFLSAIDDKINVVAKQIEKMEGWKKGLMGEMFV